MSIGLEIHGATEAKETGNSIAQQVQRLVLRPRADVVKSMVFPVYDVYVYEFPRTNTAEEMEKANGDACEDIL